MRRVKSITGISTVGILATLIAGCASSSSYSKVPVLPTSVVQINTQLEIPNGEARVYIQNGKAVTSRDRDRFEVYCSVLMNVLHEPGEPALKVSPGQFDITQVRQTNDRYNNATILTASTSWVRVGLPSNTFFTFDMRLKSSEQPDVRSLICVKESSMRGSQYPNIEEIRTALGEAVTINLAEF